MRQAASRALRAAGLAVREADDKESFLALARAGDIELLVIGMVGGSGRVSGAGGVDNGGCVERVCGGGASGAAGPALDTLRRLRADPVTAGLPAIVLAADLAALGRGAAAAALGLEDGRDICLSLPVDPTALVSAARALLRVREVERSRNLLRAVIEATSDVVFVKDRDGRFVLVNSAATRRVGRDAAAILGRDDTAILPPEQAGAVRKHDRQTMESGRAQTWEEEVVDSGGRPRWYQTTKAPLRDERGEVVGLVGIARDITQARHLAAESARLSAAVEQAAEVIFVADVTGTIVYANPACARVSGYPVHEIVGSNPRVFNSSEQDVRFWADVWQMILAGHVWRGAIVNRRKDGSRWVQEQSIAPVRNQRGTITHFVSIGQDVTEQRRAEDDRATLLRVSRDVAGTLDRRELLRRVHEHVAAGVGCDRVLTYYLDPASSEFRLVAHHGVPADLVADGAGLAFAQGSPLTERLLHGESLVIEAGREQPLLDPAIFEHFGIDGVAIVPLVVRGRVLGALAAVREAGRDRRPFHAERVRLLGSIAEQLAIAIEVSDLYEAQRDEAAVARALARVGQELVGPSSTGELLDRLCRVTNEVLGCDWSVTGILDEKEAMHAPAAVHGLAPEEWEALRTLKLPRQDLDRLMTRLERETVVHELVDDDPDPNTRALAQQLGVCSWIHIALRRGDEVVGSHHAAYRRPGEACSPLREQVARGISEIASLALRHVQVTQELEQASRIRSDFVATMSHELRTPLNVIIGYTDLLLEEDLGLSADDRTDFLRRTASTARQLLELINGTLDLSRLEARQMPLEIGAVDLPELLAEVEAEVREVNRRPDVELTWIDVADLPPLWTDRTKLKIVLKNLVGNALKFTERGSVRVEAGRAGENLEIRVSDTGIGIAPDVLPIIFEPFRQGESSLTRTYGGVGLGLHIVRRLLDLMGGMVTVQSCVGQGSTFTVRLPLGAQTVETPRAVAV